MRDVSGVKSKEISRPNDQPWLVPSHEALSLGAICASSIHCDVVLSKAEMWTNPTVRYTLATGSHRYVSSPCVCRA